MTAGTKRVLVYAVSTTFVALYDSVALRSHTECRSGLRHKYFDTGAEERGEDVVPLPKSRHIGKSRNFNDEIVNMVVVKT